MIDYAMRLTWRGAIPADLDWLLWLRRETMTEHLEAAGIVPKEEIHVERLIDRFDCIEIAEFDGNDVAMMKVVEQEMTWYLSQLQVDPLMQRSGIGRAMLTALLGRAEAAGKPVMLDVLKVNPARRLYERLGFAVTGDTDHSWIMQWHPSNR